MPEQQKTVKRQLILQNEFVIRRKNIWGSDPPKEGWGVYDLSICLETFEDLQQAVDAVNEGRFDYVLFQDEGYVPDPDRGS